MSADNRSVSTDALATLGTIIDDTQKRDAIHLAVLPMVAPCRVHGGQHVDKEGSPAKPYSRDAVGIVDPFLDVPAVNQGERFWLVIYPRVITSLRHVWAHPAFADEVPTAGYAGSESDPVAASRAWIANFADSKSLHYNQLMDGADTWVRSKEEGPWGEYLILGGLLEGESVPGEFWPHYEVVRKRQGPGRAPRIVLQLLVLR